MSEQPRGIEEGEHVRAGGVVHARGGLSRLLACRGRVAASNIEGAGDEMITCFWCLSGLTDQSLRWFKWGDGT